MPANAGSRGVRVAVGRRRSWGGQGHGHLLCYTLMGDAFQLLVENLLSLFHPQVKEEEQEGWADVCKAALKSLEVSAKLQESPGAKVGF